MKTKWIGLMLVAVLAMLACKEQTSEMTMEEETMEAPDYAAFDKKVATIRAFYKAHEDEDLEAQRAMLADTMQWSPPAYNGNQWLGKTELLEALKGYHDNFDNIQWHEGIILPDTTAGAYWSGSVFPEATATNTSTNIRIYGTWTATHTESGKEIGVKFYSLMVFNEEGVIVQGSDYFDVHGLQAQLMADE